MGQCYASSENEWFMSVYGGKVTDRSIQEIISSDVNFVDSEFLVLTLGKNLTTYKETIRIEAEGQIAKYWGLQDHYEFNGAFIFRWLSFPWDNYLDTSVAVGEGLSFASKDPEIEILNEGKTSQVLNYLAFELDFAVPGVPKCNFFTRMHHRSGIFGLIGGVNGGSNALGAGLKFTF